MLAHIVLHNEADYNKIVWTVYGTHGPYFVIRCNWFQHQGLDGMLLNKESSSTKIYIAP